MRRLAIGLLLGAVAAAAGCAHWQRGTGSWSYQTRDHMFADGFQVETLEVAVGPLYTELVWGWWR